MTRYNAGDTVKGGYYWNTGSWDATFVEGKEGLLQGDAKARYVRLPALLLLGAAPILGGLLVVFLPFIGIALFVKHIGGAALETAALAADRALATIMPARHAKIAFTQDRPAPRVDAPSEEREHSAVPRT